MIDHVLRINKNLFKHLTSLIMMEKGKPGNDVLLKNATKCRIVITTIVLSCEFIFVPSLSLSFSVSSAFDRYYNGEESIFKTT